MSNSDTRRDSSEVEVELMERSRAADEQSESEEGMVDKKSDESNDDDKEKIPPRIYLNLRNKFVKAGSLHITFLDLEAID